MDAGPSTPNFLDEQVSLKIGVIYDGVPFWKSFGQVDTDVRSSYRVVSHLYDCVKQCVNVNV